MVVRSPTAAQIEVIRAAAHVAEYHGQWIETDHAVAYDWTDRTMRVWFNPNYGYVNVWATGELLPVLQYDAGTGHIAQYRAGAWEQRLLSLAAPQRMAAA